jgi:D-lactate dehydrogenase
MAEKIVFVEMKEDWERDYVRQSLKDIAPIHFEELPVQDLDGTLRDATLLSVFIKSALSKKELEKFSKLRFVTTRSTGFDHIEIAAAKSRGILVANVPTYGENTVAEHAFALILSLSRNLRKAHFKTKEGDFSLEGLMGFDLKGKTLGVIGTGHIGLHLIYMARGFGLRVLAYDVKKNNFLSEVLGFQYVSLDEVLGGSDIISLHAPYTPATHHLINSDNISKIKRGAILINTARGGLVETSALVKALDEGILSGAGLDVLEGEELILEERRLLATAEDKEAWEKLNVALKNYVLLHRDNVIYTPHMAFYSKEAVMRILDTTISNIRGFLAGSPENVVNP